MKFIKILARVLSILCMSIIFLLALTVVSQIVTRFFNISFPQAEEISRLLIVWLTFLGSALAFYENMHLAVNFFVKRLPGKSTHLTVGLVKVLLILLHLILVIFGFSLVEKASASVSSTLQISMGYFYAAVPVSAIFAILFLIMDLRNNDKTIGEGGDPS